MGQPTLDRFYHLAALLMMYWVCQESLAMDNRIALIVGNSSYRDAPLRNPANDAADMANTLENLGFKVNKLLDADSRTMKRAIRSFGKELSQDDTVGLFYFAGHGLQVGGINYLVPINAHIESEADIEYEAINAGRILSQMSLAGNGLNLVILDACRNNPFARSFRSSTRGLARMEAPKGSLILYATSPGDVAADGEGENGLFTEKLIETINREGLTIEEVFKQTAIAVNNASNSAQVPYIEGVILGDFYFREASSQNVKHTPDPTPTPIQTQPQVQAQTQPSVNTSVVIASEVENTFWDTVKQSNSVELYQAYLDQYPNGFYSRIAEIIIKNATSQVENNKKSEKSETIEISSNSANVGQSGLVQTNGGKKLGGVSARNINENHSPPINTKDIKTVTPNNGVTSDPNVIPMAKIPQGCFKMGSFQGNSSEKPAHTVCITKPFMMGKYEVTQGQWKAIMNSNPSLYQTSDGNPVERVSWDDIQIFIELLNKKTRLNYRLPTEAEWEYACNGTEPRLFCGGDDSNDYAWYGEEWDSGHHLVGTKLPNEFGLYDMSGNVWEWVNDWYAKDYYQRSPKDDPKGPNIGTYRSNRGGSWLNSEKHARSYNRSRNKSSLRRAYLGFRLARDL